jgi:steroid delta-isomerase-like uncharacterized protein
LTEAEDVFRAFLDRANGHDIAGMQDLVADELFYRNPLMGVSDKEGLRKFQAGLFEGLPDIECHLDRLVSEGGVVMAECTVTGTHTGNLFTIPATNRKLVLPVVFVFDVAKGKIQKWSSYFDATEMMRQLGVIK